MSQASTMEPLSARIPSDLYLWLAQLQVEGATTNSDKLRVLLGQLKRQHDGAFDYAAAHAWARDLTGLLREADPALDLVAGFVVEDCFDGIADLSQQLRVDQVESEELCEDVVLLRLLHSPC